MDSNIRITMEVYLQRFSYPAVCVTLKSRHSKMFSKSRLEETETLKTLPHTTMDSLTDASEVGPTHPQTTMHTGEKLASSTEGSGQSRDVHVEE